MRHMGLFEGIGGFSLAGRWAGWDTPVMVEWNKYCQAVLNKNFPDATVFGDIRQFDGRPYAGQIDVITGGPPCQPVSHAGLRKGTDDDRWLWPEMFRVVREVAPHWVVVENVAGLVSMDGGAIFSGILADLENAGYSTETFIVPAVGLGAPHRRDRVWIVAHSEKSERQRAGNARTGRNGFADENFAAAHSYGGGRAWGPPPQGWNVLGNRGNGNGEGSGRAFDAVKFAAHPCGTGLSRREQQGASVERSGPPRPTAQRDCDGVGQWSEHWYEVATRICGISNGLPAGLDGIGDVPAKAKKGKAHRLEALGNAIVPQIAYQIFKAIQQHDAATTTTP